MSSPRTNSDDSDGDVIRRALAACADGPFFEEAEFHTLFGLTRSELREAARRWANGDRSDPTAELAIHNALNNLLGFPHRMDVVLEQDCGISRSLLAEVFSRWRARSQRADVGFAEQECSQTVESLCRSGSRGRLGQSTVLQRRCV